MTGYIVRNGDMWLYFDGNGDPSWVPGRYDAYIWNVHEWAEDAARKYGGIVEVV